MCSTSDCRRVEKARIASSRDAVELGHPLDRLRPLEPEPPRELVAELRLVEVAGGEPVGLQDRLAVERPPLAVVGAGHVGDDHVRVQVRVLRPRGAMPERRRDEALAVLADRAAVAAADDARLALEIAERRLPGRLVRLADLAPHLLVVGQRVQHADALRAREDEVVARDRREPLRLLAPLAALHVELRTVIVRSRTGVRSALPLAGLTPRSSVPSSPSSTTPTSPSAAAPLPAQIPGDSPRPA